MFNSLKHVKKLEEAGIPREQAETHIQIVTEIMETSLATKEDVKELQMAVKQTFQELRQEMKYDLSLIDQKIIQSEQRMTIKLGTIVSLAIGVAVVLAKIMI